MSRQPRGKARITHSKSGASTWGADKEIGAVSGAAINRTVSSLIGGLDAGATYEWGIWASNAQGDSAALAGTFTTLAADALATGGTVSTVGLRRIHTFTANGTLSLPAETVLSKYAAETRRDHSGPLIRRGGASRYDVVDGPAGAPTAFDAANPGANVPSEPFGELFKGEQGAGQTAPAEGAG